MFDFKTDFGRYIRQVRESRVMSIRKLADEAEEPPTMIARIEAGDRLPDGSQLWRLADALDVDRDRMLANATPAGWLGGDKLDALAKQEPYLVAALLALVPDGQLEPTKYRALLIAAKELAKSAKAVGGAAEDQAARKVQPDTPLYSQPETVAGVEAVIKLTRRLVDTGRYPYLVGADGLFRAVERMDQPKAEEVASIIRSACDQIKASKKDHDTTL